MHMMGFDGDYKSIIAQELQSRLWKRNSRLSPMQIQKFRALLDNADSATLLSFTVALGRLIWSDYLEAKRRKFVKKLSEKIRQWSVKKKKRRGKPGKFTVRRIVTGIVTGIHLRPVLGSKLRMVVKRKAPKPNKVKRQHVKHDHSCRMFRLAMAMMRLSVRNVYITTEWEFWAICFVKELCGFWGSTALEEGFSDSLITFAKKFELNVVSSQNLERLQSCYGCSSSSPSVGTRTTVCLKAGIQ